MLAGTANSLSHLCVAASLSVLVSGEETVFRGSPKVTPFLLPTKISHLREENASRYNYRGSQKPINYLDGSYQNCRTFLRLQASMIDTNDRCCGSIIIFSRRRVTPGPSTTSCSPMYHWRPVAPRSTGDNQLHPILPVTTKCTPIYPSQQIAPQSLSLIHI